MTKFRLTAGGFTAEDFERYIHVRLGDGDPVYWYAVGDGTTFPDGNMFVRNEGYDTGRLYQFDRDRSEAIGLTRKFILMRNAQTGEILKGPDGQPAWVSNFTYQLFKMRLQDGFLTYEAQQGAGDFLNTAIGGLNRSEIQKLDGMTIYTTPINYTMPIDQGGNKWEPVWETYDFIERQHNGQPSYDGLWAGGFPLPEFMGGGRSSMHAYFHRFDRYADLPESIRAFVNEYAPMWQEPPLDMDEIRDLQK